MAAVIAIGAGVVVALWWHDTQAQSLHTLGGQLIGAGQVTGLVGTYLIVVEVLLMGRIPWLDRLVGMDRLAVWHRYTGEYALGLLIAHTLLTVWGYSVTDHAGTVHESWVLLRSYPDMVAATVGLVVLIGVGVSSLRAVRRRIKYQTWYFIHLYAYLGIAVSFAHQLATGGDFVSHPLNRAAWVALYVFATMLLLWCRVGTPVRDAVRHQLRVIDLVPEAADVVSIYVGGRRLDELRADAGQFFLWRFLTPRGWWQAHPFSLSAAPNGQWLRLTAKSVGDHTAEIASLHPGVRVLVEGPYGAFTRHRRTRRHVLLIAGGIGIAPVRALFEALPGKPGEVTLLYRASKPTDVVFRQELEELALTRGAAVHYVVGPRTMRPDPIGADHLRQLVPDVAHHDVYVCGPRGMMHQVVATLRRLGVPRRHIHTEGFEY